MGLIIKCRFNQMRKIIKYLFLILIAFAIYCFFPTSPSNELLEKLSELKKEYSNQNLNKDYSILIDYNKPIFKKRLWVIDNKTKEVVLNTFVSQAKNSGLIFASDFSNIPQSKKSSIGVFKTLGSYESNYGKGEYKLGMRLKGLQKGINDKVFERNIVFHPSYGLWSEGCFMTSPKTNKKIIDLTKNGSLLYVNFD